MNFQVERKPCATFHDPVLMMNLDWTCHEGVDAEINKNCCKNFLKKLKGTKKI